MLEMTREATCQGWKLERAALAGKSEKKNKKKRKRFKVKTRKGSLNHKNEIKKEKRKRKVEVKLKTRKGGLGGWGFDQGQAKSEILL